MKIVNFFKDFLNGDIVGESVYVYFYVFKFFGKFDGFFYVKFIKILILFWMFDYNKWVYYFIYFFIEFVDC